MTETKKIKMKIEKSKKTTFLFSFFVVLFQTIEKSICNYQN